MACACVIMLAIGCGKPNVGQLLDRLTLWIETDSDDDRKVLHENIKEICRFSVGPLRKGLEDYLNDPMCDERTRNFRTDNVCIICAVYFNVPPSHPYRVFFYSLADSDFSIRKPTILDRYFAAKGWPDGYPSVEKKELMDEFDRLEKSTHKPTKAQAGPSCQGTATTLGEPRRP